MQWKSLFQESVVKGSEQYLKKDAVQNVTQDGNVIEADVKGLEDFHVKVEASGAEVSLMECTCPLSKSGQNCKHMAAVLLYADENGIWNNASDEKKEDSERKVTENEDISAVDAVEEPIKEVSTEYKAMPEIRDSKPKSLEVPIPDSGNLVSPQMEKLDEKVNVTYTVNWPFKQVHDENIKITAEVNPLFAFSVYQNGNPLVKSITITNESEKEYKNLVIRAYSDFYFFDMEPNNCGTIGPREQYPYKAPVFRIHGTSLRKLTEKITCNLYICLTYGDEEVARYSTEISVLAMNQWPGVDYDEVLLASYITPNHPAITNLLYYASTYLEKQTGNPSLEAYQSGKPQRILEMATAAYASIQMKNITYATAPAGFIHDGQKIRFVDEMLAVHMGNCMDMTLLYAACLEQMGLNPILVLVDGHIFSGVWLVNQNFPDSYTTDPTLIEKEIEMGNLIVVESTSMCSGDKVSFDEAMTRAKLELANYSSFNGVIDIRRARMGNVKPMPLEKRDTGFFELEHHDLKENELTGLSEKQIEEISIGDLKDEKISKLTQWERKLLDLSTRNPLISISKKAIPLLVNGLNEIEDAFAENAEYKLRPVPEEWIIRGVNEILLPEGRSKLGEYEDLIRQNIKKNILHTVLNSDKDVEKEMAHLYRATKDAMAESGANTLYLVLGELRWTEGKTDKSKWYYAPIVLVPVEMIRKSANEGYVIRGIEDETLINITLLEFLKQKFNLDIQGLNPIPEDEHGVDINKIFYIFRKAISKMPTWDVLENAYLGNFSFTQFVMWNDIHTHPEMLRRSKVVEALMDGEVEWNTYVPSLNHEDQPYLPVSVDESQLRAVNMAANDVSFVLHGPPGAGKSQTITAMIANAMTRGKTVLFVAEKPAALSVVKNRLDAIGIGDFCIEIHSNKVKKSHVLDQLKRVRENYRVRVFRTDYDERLDEIIEKRAELDEYGIALHKSRHFGLSIKELIDEYESILEKECAIRPDKEFIETITDKELEKKCVLLERLIAAGKILGHPSGHVFSEIGLSEYSKSLKIDLDNSVDTYLKAIQELKEAGEQTVSKMGDVLPVSKADWLNLFALSKALLKSVELPAWLMQPGAVEESGRVLNAFIEKREQTKKGSEEFFARYKESILSIDLNLYITKYAEAGRKFFGKDKAIAAVSAEIGNHTNFPVTQDMLPAMSGEIMAYRTKKSEYDAFRQTIPQHLLEFATDTLTAEEVAEKVAHWQEMLSVVQAYATKIATLKAAGILEAIIPDANALLEKESVVAEKEQALESLLVTKIPESTSSWIEGKEEYTKKLVENYAQLRDWITFQEAKKECLENGLSDICELYLAGMEHDLVVPGYKKAIYNALIWAIIAKEPVLNKFTGNSFTESIREYKNMEDELKELTKTEMLHKLSGNIPTGYEDSKSAAELKVLNKAITSGGRGISIRNLFDKAPHVIRRYCPCFLMSPLSVAQYISPDSDLFDIVMFDEASQIRTCEAVGSLARGKNAVIVGDPKQMPPTSFFMSDTFDEENVDVEDLDSILDDCMVLGMPESHLKWHYRSRHESLIAFSNKYYYDNNMLTFPSVNDRERRVKLCTINGLYKAGKDRTNEPEAKAIVAEVLRRFENENLQKYSVGIVTFNETQRKLIETLLEEEFKKNPALDAWANKDEEPLIIRNLENVQGDERDVILFSETYGLDEDRRWVQSFGPLNNEGGQRRLNVAVSRAKQEMIIFSSITSDMIKEPKSEGVKGLKNFLRFAAMGELGDSTEKESRHAAGMKKAICNFLEEHGYAIQCDIGHSNFKVDIAVVNPFDESEYLLGIMTDGTTYSRSLNNTNDREIAQISILKGLGWDIYRTWTMDWWDNKEQELTKLLSFVEEKKKAAENTEGKQKDFDYFPPSETIDAPNTTPKSRKKASTKKGRYVTVTELGKTNRFEKKTYPFVVLENNIFETPKGDFFRAFQCVLLPLISSAYDNYAVYEVKNKGEELLYLLVNEKEIRKDAEKYIDENVPEEISEGLEKLYPDVETADFLAAFNDCLDPETKKTRFKNIRSIMPHTKITEEAFCPKEDIED